MSDVSPDKTALDNDFNIRKMEIDAGKHKVLFGTAAVGISVAFFPFAQSFAESFFNNSQANHGVVADRVASKRGFLESLSSEARSPDLDERIILAEYYANLTEDVSERGRWLNFLKLLTEQRETQRERDLENEKVKHDPNATPVQIAVAQTQKDQLDRSAAAGAAPRNVIDPRTIRQLISALDSGDSASRRNARIGLADYGLALVIPAANELAKPGKRYRLNLGLIIALAKMIDENRGLRQEVINLLNVEVLEKIMGWATDNDPTIRTNAGNFLYDLGDPRVFDFLGKLWVKTNDINGRYNLALAAKSAAPFIPASDISGVEMLLRSLLPSGGDKTDKLLKQAIKLLPSNED